MGKTDADRPSPMIIRRLGAYVDQGLLKFFGTLAGFVADRPKTILWSCVAFSLLSAAGIARIHVNNDPETLYTPQGNQAFRDRDYVEALYGYPDKNADLYATSSPAGSNVITKQSLLDFLSLFDTIMSVQGEYKGVSFTFEDPKVCSRPGGPSTPCDMLSVLDYWNYSRSAIQADQDVLATVSNPSAYDRLGRPLVPNAVLGNVSRDSQTGKVLSAFAFKATINVQNNKGGSGSSKVDHVTDEWQKSAVAEIKKFSSSNIKVYVISDWESDDVSSKAITGDVSLLVFGYILLLLFGMLVLSKPHPVDSRGHLALANIASCAMAVMSSYGFCMLIGVQFSLVTQVLALILLGLGTDDTLVTMAAHEETGLEMPNASIKERIMATVSRARRGVIVASATNFVAFCTGIISELPALRDFMVYAAVGVVFVLIYQSLFFVACLTLDVKRQRANKLAFCCCYTSQKGPSEGLCGCTYNPTSKGPAQVMIGSWLPKIILHPVGKIVVISVSLFLLVSGAIGCARVRENFEVEWFTPDGTYLKHVYKVRDEYFSSQNGKGALPIAAYTKNLASPPLDYFNYQDELEAIAVNLKKNPSVSPAPELQSWYLSFIGWLKSPPSSSTNQTASYSYMVDASGRPKTSTDFYYLLRQYLNTDGQRFSKDVVFSNSSNNVIVSSRMQFFSVNLVDSPHQVDAMHSMRKTVQDSAPSLNAIAYSFPFLFFEGYAVIAKDTVLAVSIAAAIVFIVMLLMLADVTASVLVGVMVALIDVELMGFIHWAGLSFNSVTSINLLLAIGIAVDYSAFTAFSFLTQLGKTRDERVHKALAQFGVAVFNGGFTVFLAIAPLVAAKSYIFQVFFKMFLMIVVLGLWHGLCLLPVLLSFIGSFPYESAYEREELMAASKAAEIESQQIVRVKEGEAPAMQSMN